MIKEEYIAMCICSKCNTLLNYAQKYCANGVCCFCGADASNDFYVDSYKRIAIKTTTTKWFGIYLNVEYRWKDTGEALGSPNLFM